VQINRTPYYNTIEAKKKELIYFLAANFLLFLPEFSRPIGRRLSFPFYDYYLFLSCRLFTRFLHEVGFAFLRFLWYDEADAKISAVDIVSKSSGRWG
jgi:hypothetical protein